MFGNIRLRRAGRRDDVVDRARLFADCLQNFQAHRLAQHLEAAGNLLQFPTVSGRCDFSFDI